MQYKQKNFLMSALVAVLGFALVTASGCDTEGDNKGKDDGKTKDVDVMTVGKVAKSADFINADEVDRVVVSGDGNWAYFTATKGATLHAANIGGAKDFAKNIADKTKWAKIGVKTAGDDGVPGDAKLDGADPKFTKLVPTKAGVLVSQSSSDDKNGAALILGKDYKVAWFGTDANTVNITNPGAADRAITAHVLTKSTGEEYVYLFVDGRFTANTINAAIGADGSGVKVKLANELSRNTAAFNAVPEFISAGVANKNYIVNQQGIHAIVDTELGATKAAAVAAGEFVPAKWELVATSANNKVTSLAVSGDFLFIGLNSDGAGAANEGGVAVFNHKTNTAVAMTGKNDWKAVAVKALAKDSTGKVWAVTAKGLIEAKSDGTPGSKIDAASVKKDGYEGESFPADHITGAAFVGKNMIVTTSDAGVYTVAAGKKQVKEKQE